MQFLKQTKGQHLSAVAADVLSSVALVKSAHTSHCRAACMSLALCDYWPIPVVNMCSALCIVTLALPHGRQNWADQVESHA